LVRLSSDAIFARAFVLRETIVGVGQARARNCVQRMFEVVTGKLQREFGKNKLSPADVASAFRNFGLAASSSEAITYSFVDSCLTVFDRMLYDTSVLYMVLDIEEEATRKGKPGPLDSIYKLEAVVQQGRRLPEMTWLIGAVRHFFKNGLRDPSECNVRAVLVLFELLRTRLHVRTLRWCDR